MSLVNPETINQVQSSRKKNVEIFIKGHKNIGDCKYSETSAIKKIILMHAK